jgi:hypothetical protein
MTIEEVFTQEWLWAAIAAMVAVAGTAGGVISWLIAVWIRHRDRPEPEWVFQVLKSEGRAVTSRKPEHDGIRLSGKILNAGDGTAFSVRLEGRNCSADLDSKELSGMRLAGVVRPGDSVAWSCHMTVNDWDEADLVLSFVVAPTRHQKTQLRTFSVKDIAVNPVSAMELEAAEAETRERSDLSQGVL